MSVDSEIAELYQQLIIDHSKRPRNKGTLAGATRQAVGHNPLCGDRVTVYLRLDADRLADVKFEGVGCAICTASASLMTEKLKGLTEAQVYELFDRFHGLLTGQAGYERAAEELGKLAALAGVKRFPIRVKCATLPWHTLKAALTGQDLASTE
jgi:nitrogen fixation NifU-like protein